MSKRRFGIGNTNNRILEKDLRSASSTCTIPKPIFKIGDKVRCTNEESLELEDVFVIKQRAFYLDLGVWIYDISVKEFLFTINDFAESTYSVEEKYLIKEGNKMTVKHEFEVGDAVELMDEHPQVDYLRQDFIIHDIKYKTKTNTFNYLISDSNFNVSLDEFEENELIHTIPNNKKRALYNYYDEVRITPRSSKHYKTRTNTVYTIVKMIFNYKENAFVYILEDDERNRINERILEEDLTLINKIPSSIFKLNDKVRVTDYTKLELDDVYIIKERLFNIDLNIWIYGISVEELLIDTDSFVKSTYFIEEKYLIKKGE